MPYTHCNVCGAKALVGATRCPRCQAPFVSYDPKGERVPTVNCPNCGVQRPVAIGVCPNCLMSTAPSGWRLTRGLILAGLSIGVIVAIGYVMSRRAEHTTTTGRPAVAADTSPVTDSTALRETAVTFAVDSPTRPTANPAKKTAEATTPAGPIPAAAVPTVPAAAAATKPPAPKPAQPPSVAVPDTGQWEYATANTWVRVRSAPTRASDVLRMVDSAQRVRLGPPTAGWRPIRVGVDRGWVDPRLFTVTPAPKP